MAWYGEIDEAAFFILDEAIERKINDFQGRLAGLKVQT